MHRIVTNITSLFYLRRAYITYEGDDDNIEVFTVVCYDGTSSKSTCKSRL
jgi:hypothetical protein